MSRHRILIVEDQREVSRLLRSALETLEFEIDVVEIPSGEEAILDSSRNKIDLLVADYRLPGMTGIELMNKVKRYHPEAKIILVTGQTDPRIRKNIAEAGADAFFLKPVPIADFLDAVERHLNLVETILPPEPIQVEDVEEVRHSLPDLLAGLRQELAATAVILLNDTGRILARAGDLPDRDNEVALISSLLSIYSAGQKVSRIIEQKIASNWYIFEGGKYELVFSPVGSTHAMLIIGQEIAGEDKVLQTVNIFTKVRTEIEQAIGETTGNSAITREVHLPQVEAIEAAVSELEPMFRDAKKNLKPADVNEFWDKAADEHIAAANPDMLSYEQAKQLGLAPEDES
jgi:CheY-like chemotaxis protein